MSENYRVLTITMTTGLTVTTSLDMIKIWDRVMLEVPTSTSGCDLYLQGANYLGGTFRRVTFPVPLTATAQNPIDFKIGSAVTTRIIPIEVVLPRFIKVEASTAQTDTTRTFNFLCAN